jgi:hypothetical protein
MGLDGEPVRVEIHGNEDRDGTTERYILVGGNIDLFDATAARALAHDLPAAADEMEALAD